MNEDDRWQILSYLAYVSEILTKHMIWSADQIQIVEIIGIIDKILIILLDETESNND